MRKTLKCTFVFMLVVAISIPLTAQKIRTTYAPNLAKKILQFAREKGNLNNVHPWSPIIKKIEINKIATEGAILFSMNPTDAKKYFKVAFTNAANSSKITQKEAIAFLAVVDGYYDGDDLNTSWSKLETLKAVCTSSTMTAMTSGIESTGTIPSARDIAGDIGGIITTGGYLIATGGLGFAFPEAIEKAFEIGRIIGEAVYDVGNWLVNVFKKDNTKALGKLLGDVAEDVAHAVGNAVIDAVETVGDGFKKLGKALGSVFSKSENKKKSSVMIGPDGQGDYHPYPF